MSSEAWQILGFAVAAVTMIGGLIIRDRQIFAEIKKGEAELHERINNVQEKYVRRDDLNGHIESMQHAISEVRNEQRGTNTRIDALLIAMSNKDK